MSRRVGMTGFFLRRANVLTACGISRYCSVLEWCGLHRIGASDELL